MSGIVWEYNGGSWGLGPMAMVVPTIMSTKVHEDISGIMILMAEDLRMIEINDFEGVDCWGCWLRIVKRFIKDAWGHISDWWRANNYDKWFWKCIYTSGSKYWKFNKVDGVEDVWHMVCVWEKSACVCLFAIYSYIINFTSRNIYLFQNMYISI